MIFRKGCKVEVLSKKDAPSGSWRCGEIICGDDHHYVVRYDGFPDTPSEMVLKRVPKKAVRPCPPLTEVVENWLSGDVIEVFDNLSWKMATITKVLSKRSFLVRLMGSSLEFKLSKGDIRSRHSWQDNSWIVIGKGSVICRDGKFQENLTLTHKHNSKFPIQSSSVHVNGCEDLFLGTTKENFQEFDAAPHKTSKRGQYGCSQVEACDGAFPKFRAIEKDCRQGRVAASQFSSAEQVDMPRAKLMGFSFDNRIGFSVTDDERRKLSDGLGGNSSAVDFESNDSDAIASSIGSCSINNSTPYEIPCHTGFMEDDVLCTDGESFCKWRAEGNSLHKVRKELPAEIHSLELHAYRCTIEALHASGPLSWEQEALMSNLRLFLNISNEEHLMERNIIDLLSYVRESF
ncbi:hypothetical protein K2173_016614 [Erythroxylum novogranatense]|uniref:ENT domain-containing protein n=1 Tax=Erythroxylum novogranatense TaxID=1862640 RepID=A0AAV8SHJ9_9ROSI|nr:hypothetical protein K2173_016614 [Erythroxylum novogranatense]